MLQEFERILVSTMFNHPLTQKLKQMQMDCINFILY